MGTKRVRQLPLGKGGRRVRQRATATARAVHRRLQQREGLQRVQAEGAPQDVARPVCSWLISQPGFPGAGVQARHGTQGPHSASERKSHVLGRLVYEQDRDGGVPRSHPACAHGWREVAVGRAWPFRWQRCGGWTVTVPGKGWQNPVAPARTRAGPNLHPPCPAHPCVLCSLDVGLSDSACTSILICTACSCAACFGTDATFRVRFLACPGEGDKG